MNCYAVDKVLYQPKLVERFLNKDSHIKMPVFVHMMWQNHCNHNCSFCAYRFGDRTFDTQTHMPIEKVRDIVTELDDIGVKAIEITGGGEPLAHPEIRQALGYVADTDMQSALVTNGTLLNDSIADRLYATELQWARVSIDAGCVDDYTSIRDCPTSHWELAWRGVDNLVSRRKHQVIGTGFVVTEENYKGVKEHCRLAKEHGVNNVRVSAAFTPKGADLLTAAEKLNVRSQLHEAEQYNDKSFQIYNLFDERINNMYIKVQNYDYCGIKDLLCVITGTCDVYTCCTLVGLPAGYIGNLDESFSTLWNTTAEWRKNFVPRERCVCNCLYEKRNQVLLGLRNPPQHLEFI